jgi:bla regulator protein blaR1
MMSSLTNHLWQSTLFALLAGLLTLTLRQERARVRYWLWLAASVKFLIPFAWFSALGSRFASVSGIGVVRGHRFYDAMEVMAGRTSGVVIPGFADHISVFAALWLCGFLGVVACWCLRWRKFSRTVADAASLQEGREVETLRRVAGKLGLQPTEIVQSAVAHEPGVFGIVTPVLIWPEGISDALSDVELEAILTHEARHIQRRDNLTAAIHMMVEAFFWFHPLVWWMGARLVVERERACDEDVVALGSEPRAYAAGILKVCEFCLRAPLPCMSGVSGGDLKQRMVWIMTNRVLHELGFGKKMAIGVVALTCIAGPVAVGLVHASEARSESASPSTVIASTEQGGERVQASKNEMMGLVVKKVPPVYPEAAKKAHVQGEVVLRATIGKKGDVENLQLVSGSPQLAPAAIEAVKQWKYRPYMKDGHAVEVETDITVNFTLME